MLMLFLCKQCLGSGSVGFLVSEKYANPRIRSKKQKFHQNFKKQTKFYSMVNKDEINKNFLTSECFI